MRYFLSRYNKLYAFIVHQRIYTLYLLSMAILLFLIVVWFFCSYRLLSKKIEDVKQYSFVATKELDKEQCKQLERSIFALKKNIAAHSFPTQPLSIFYQAADHAGINLEKYAIKPGKEKSMIVDCAFVIASLDQVISFFDYLYKHQMFFLCDQLSIENNHMRSTFILHKEIPSTLEKS